MLPLLVLSSRKDFDSARIDRLELTIRPGSRVHGVFHRKLKRLAGLGVLLIDHPTTGVDRLGELQRSEDVVLRFIGDEVVPRACGKLGEIRICHLSVLCWHTPTKKVETVWAAATSLGTTD